MRLAFRWLVFLIPLTLLLVVVVQNRQQLASADGLTGFLSEIVSILTYFIIPTAQYVGYTPKVSSSTAIFWRQWAKTMLKARPDSPSVDLRGSASTQEPGGDGTRQPYRDLVTNSADSIEGMRKSHAKFVEELSVPYNLKIFMGRGVALVGGGEYFGPAIISIHMLRRTGCTLPVEVFVPNEDEYERELCERYLPKLNARCIVLSRILKRSGGDAKRLEIKRFQLKAVAALLSSFDEVLLLDSDSIPLVDPEAEIFNKEPYKSKGLIIWPDFWQSSESPKFWTVAGKSSFPEGLPATASETGQVVVNKRTHLETLLLATYYNIYGEQFYYPLLSQGALGQGDKETFMAAAVALNASYYRVKQPVASIGRDLGTQTKGTAMLQHLPADDYEQSRGGTNKVRVAFLHSNTPKMNAGHLVDEGDLFKSDGKSRLRLLGSKQDQVSRFGFDLESTIWDLLVQTGCELAKVVREWKTRDKLCERLEEHHKEVFGND